VVVLFKWADRDEQKYYDAKIVSADRKEHSAGETALLMYTLQRVSTLLLAAPAPTRMLTGR
jgi:hypothetical protein